MLTKASNVPECAFESDTYHFLLFPIYIKTFCLNTPICTLHVRFIHFINNHILYSHFQKFQFFSSSSSFLPYLLGFQMLLGLFFVIIIKLLFNLSGGFCPEALFGFGFLWIISLCSCLPSSIAVVSFSGSLLFFLFIL